MTSPNQSPPNLASVLGLGAFEIGGGPKNYGQEVDEGFTNSAILGPGVGLGFGVTDILGVMAKIAEFLLTLPFQALKMFQGFIPGATDSDFSDQNSAVNFIMSMMNFNPLELLFTIVKQIIDIFNGLVVTPVNEAVQGVKDFFTGIGDQFGDVFNGIGDLFNNLWGGLTGGIGHGKSAADVGNAASTTRTQASTAIGIGEWNNAILSLRNNKSLMEGIDETEEANFPVDSVWSGTTTEPVATISATAASVPVAYWRAGEAAKKGFISWFGKGFANISALYLDVYKANFAANRWDLIHTSPNQISAVDNTWRYLIYNIQDVVNRIDVSAGVVLGVAWRVEGTGTHSIAGIPVAGMPLHPTVHPKTPASTRTGVGNLAFASTNYVTTIPWFGIGIVTGDIPPPFYAPRTQAFSAAGDFTYNIPPEYRVAGNLIDGVGLGGGGGGSDSLFAATGNGGYAGAWADRTLVYGTDIPLGTTQLIGRVGAGGNRGGYGGAPAGQVTTISLPDGTVLLTANGGEGGTSGNSNGGNGQGAGDHTYNDKPYFGGGNVGNGKTGTAPGGGGGGGFPYLSGGPGAAGSAWITVRQP